MRSSSRKGKADPQQRVRDAVLLHLAEALGPALDHVEIAQPALLRVSDVVGALRDAGVASPAEIRAAMLDLADSKLLSIEDESELERSRGLIGLRSHGLVAARRVKPGIGRPRVIELELAPKPNSRFRARLKTDSKDLDKRINGSGVALACFYVLALLNPRQSNPTTVDALRGPLQDIAVLGIGRRRGPSRRLEPDDATVRKELIALGPVLGLSRVKREEDGRSEEWYLPSGFPDVRVRAPRTAEHMQDWRSLLQELRNEMHDRARERERVEARERASEAESDAIADPAMSASAGAGAEPQ